MVVPGWTRASKCCFHSLSNKISGMVFTRSVDWLDKISGMVGQDQWNGWTRSVEWLDKISGMVWQDQWNGWTRSVEWLDKISGMVWQDMLYGLQHNSLNPQVINIPWPGLYGYLLYVPWLESCQGLFCPIFLREPDFKLSVLVVQGQYSLRNYQSKFVNS